MLHLLTLPNDPAWAGSKEAWRIFKTFHSDENPQPKPVKNLTRGASATSSHVQQSFQSTQGSSEWSSEWQPQMDRDDDRNADDPLFAAEMAVLGRLGSGHLVMHFLMGTEHMISVVFCTVPTPQICNQVLCGGDNSVFVQVNRTLRSHECSCSLCQQTARRLPSVPSKFLEGMCPFSRLILVTSCLMWYPEYYVTGFRKEG